MPGNLWDQGLWDQAQWSGPALPTGALTASEAPDVAAVAASSTWRVTLAASEAQDSAAINITSFWSATLAATEAADTAALGGTIADAGTIAGSITVLEARDTAAVSAALTGNAGTLSAFETLDTADLVGDIPLVVTVTLDATEQADTAFAYGEIISNDLPGVLNFGRRQKSLIGPWQMR